MKKAKVTFRAAFLVLTRHRMGRKQELSSFLSSGLHADFGR
jgi:hypothetical protein